MTLIFPFPFSFFSAHGLLSVLVPETSLGEVSLSFPHQGYRQIGHDDLLHMLVPQGQLYPNSKILVPVFVEDRSR
jgi:hypothetical protein